MNIESEILEREALADLHAAATAAEVQSLGLQCLRDGSTLISIASALPDSAIVINRALGLGLSEPESEASIDKIVSAYRASRVERYFIQVHPHAQPADIPVWLARAGIESARAWQKFSRGQEAIAPIETKLRVEEIGAEYGDAFARIVCAGFDLGDQAVSWLARLPGRPRWHVFMAFDGSEPAGAGALFVDKGLGWLDYAATRPEFRRRGSQTAVLAGRVNLALQLNCRRLYTCTGVAVTGDPQHSYANILRAGFHETYIRQNFAPPRN